ncbi:nuclear distribution protein nudE-like 1 [Biomphalaria pfeifferi]|uniref:Nuclear distribution protein nudE-like 1 n=1 Tax=Biomphalaria pfeifferi TaxID=112525 RepID=A0AAD8BRI2_BIOPF|nr:nuclear distribution protein nudE-like 1 [Biomphalaria pfeifferi]
MASKKSAPKGKRSPSGKKGKKEEIEDPIITFLKKTTEDLREENATLKASLSTYQEKLQVITQQIIDVNFDNYKAPQDIALVDIPLADILTIITNLTITPSNKLHSYELQIEELETRVTQLNSELAKLIKLKLKLENELKDMDRMYTVEDLKVQAKRLWYDCCTTHLFVSPSEGKNDYYNMNGTLSQGRNFSEASTRTQSAVSHQSIDLSSVPDEVVIPPIYLNVLKPKSRSINLMPKGIQKENLIPPEKKLPGETHIFDLHEGLRSIIIRNLSKRKGNGNDWRLMAARVGLPEDLVQHWLAMRAPNAMALVMKVWGDSAGATVRMLHRHLSSPQMREVILAKMLSDFYDVE